MARCQATRTKASQSFHKRLAQGAQLQPGGTRPGARLRDGSETNCPKVRGAWPSGSRRERCCRDAGSGLDGGPPARSRAFRRGRSRRCCAGRREARACRSPHSRAQSSAACMSAEPMPLRRRPRATITPTSATCGSTDSGRVRSTGARRSPVRLGHQHGGMRMPAESPEVAPLLRHAPPRRVRQQPALGLRRDRCRERNEQRRVGGLGRTNETPSPRRRRRRRRDAGRLPRRGAVGNTSTAGGAAEEEVAPSPAYDVVANLLEPVELRWRRDRPRSGRAARRGACAARRWPPSTPCRARGRSPRSA